MRQSIKFVVMASMLTLALGAAGCGKKDGANDSGSSTGLFGGGSASKGGAKPSQPTKPSVPQGNASGGLKGSCEIQMANMHYCSDFTGSAADAAQLEQICAQIPGKFSTGACPTSGQVAQCVVNAGQPEEEVYHFYQGFNQDAINGACSGN